MNREDLDAIKSPDTNAFGQPVDLHKDDAPDELDINAWLDGTTQPAETVKIYRDAGARAEYQDLEDRFLDLQARLGDTDPDDDPSPDVSLGETPPTEQLLQIAQQMRDVYDRLQHGARRVRIRALSHDEKAKLREESDRLKVSDKDKLDWISYAMLREGTTLGLDVDGWKRLQNRIGDLQYARIIDALNRVNGFDGDFQVAPDFSHAASAILATGRS